MLFLVKPVSLVKSMQLLKRDLNCIIKGTTVKILGGGEN